MRNPRVTGQEGLTDTDESLQNSKVSLSVTLLRHSASISLFRIYRGFGRSGLIGTLNPLKKTGVQSQRGRHSTSSVGTLIGPHRGSTNHLFS